MPLYLYRTWQNMKDRALNPKNPWYRNYGGRGIKVHPAWVKDFLAFARDVGLRPSPKHTLDRIQVNGNYEPGNVRWATRSEQANNQRKNRWLEHDGRRQTLSQWAKEAGMPVVTLLNRLDRSKLPIGLALTLPRYGRHKRL